MTSTQSLSCISHLLGSEYYLPYSSGLAKVRPTGLQATNGLQTQSNFECPGSYFWIKWKRNEPVLAKQNFVKKWGHLVTHWKVNFLRSQFLASQVFCSRVWPPFLEVCVPELVLNETRLELISRIGDTGTRPMFSGLVTWENSGYLH